MDDKHCINNPHSHPHPHPHTHPRKYHTKSIIKFIIDIVLGAVLVVYGIYRYYYIDTSGVCSESIATSTHTLTVSIPDDQSYLQQLTQYITQHYMSLFFVLTGLTWIIGTKRILRYPFLLIMIAVIMIELFIYIGLRFYVRALELLMFQSRRSRRLTQQLQHADSYDSWQSIAIELDTLHHRDEFKLKNDSRYYNSALVEKVVKQLHGSRIEHQNTQSHNKHHTTSKRRTSTRRANSNDHTSSRSTKSRSKSLGRSSNGKIDQSRKHIATSGNRSNIQLAIDNIDQHKHYNTSFTTNAHCSTQQPTNDVQFDRLLALVQTCTNKALFGALNENLYSKTLTGTKYLVEQFIDELVQSIQYIEQHCVQLINSGEYTVEQANEVLRIVNAIKLGYGSTALCLSGGASVGNYHWGVIAALTEQSGNSASKLPNIISGTSSGSVVATLVCTRTDNELQKLLVPDLYKHINSFSRNLLSDQPNTWFNLFVHWWKHGVMFDENDWYEKIRWFTRDMTFLEAYQHTGRVLNITATSSKKHSPPILFNYINTPHVEIASAVISSVAVPSFVKPQRIYERVNGKRVQLHDGAVAFSDGSIESDIPLTQLSELFGASYFIVSQCNPHILPFFYNNRGESGGPSRWRRRSGGYRGM